MAVFKLKKIKKYFKLNKSLVKIPAAHIFLTYGYMGICIFINHTYFRNIRFNFVLTSHAILNLIIVFR